MWAMHATCLQHSLPILLACLLAYHHSVVEAYSTLSLWCKPKPSYGSGSFCQACRLASSTVVIGEAVPSTDALIPFWDGCVWPTNMTTNCDIARSLDVFTWDSWQTHLHIGLKALLTWSKNHEYYNYKINGWFEVAAPLWIVDILFCGFSKQMKEKFNVG